MKCAALLLLALLAAPDMPAQSTLPDASLGAFVSRFQASLPGAGSGGYVPPSQQEADAFRTAIGCLLDGEVLEARDRLDALGYELAYLSDSADTWLVAYEPESESLGRGAFVVSPRYERNLAIEVPHPLHDTNTAGQGAVVFEALGARLLSIAGAHRCASPLPSGCSGTTTSCSPGVSQGFRLSDVAHSTPSFFQAAHEAADDEGMHAFNLHGNSSEVPDVELSDGTKQARGEDAPVNRLRAALAARGVAVASCNRTADEPASLALCGTTNVQGRHTNGSPAPCTTAAAEATGTFFHVEQHKNVRNDPADLIAAAASVIERDPATMPGITALSPPSAPARSPATTVTIHGSGFHPGAVASAGGTALATLFLSDDALTATIPASLLASTGTLPIRVRNLDTTESGTKAFTVTAAKRLRLRGVRH